MARIIAVANQKGGVGKTTTAINLSAALGVTQRRVLLVDMDPQGNAPTGAGIDKDEVELSVCDVLLGNCECRQAIVSPEHVKFDVLPGNADLTAAEVKLMGQRGRERRLAVALDSVAGDYDYIYIDCPPALNVLTLVVALMAGSRITRRAGIVTIRTTRSSLSQNATSIGKRMPTVCTLRVRSRSSAPS